DHRAFSRTVSHLRMGYFLTWAAFLCVGARLRGWLSPIFSVIYLAVTAFSLIWLKSLGMIPFILFIVVWWIWWLRPLKPRLKPFLWAGIPLFLLFFYGVWETYQAWHFYHLRPDPARLHQTLQLQAPYVHLDAGEMLENGVPVLIGLNEPSLERAWRARSKMEYWGMDLKGQQLRVTLWRYLASCGYWAKDSAAVAGLSPHDVRAVEKGVTNRLMRSPWRLAGRIFEILWEWDRYRVDRNPRGRSLATRLELWEAAWDVVKDHPLQGVGLGDVRVALAEALDSRHSPLLYLQTYGPHNQWLGLAMAGGIPLLLWVVLSILLPIVCIQCSWIPSSAFFLGVLLLGCGLWEDVWETQASVTFFSYFFWLNILCKPTPHSC
ncbi:MAG: O-antigen ligase family protein, partial [Flavobacteriales bacterium]|nr:O-antigen ligase family protein [Flavobacteriales bacterium]MDW8409769.1 O-antigen ligase family protein [Flavobacteriales bacterium]